MKKLIPSAEKYRFQLQLHCCTPKLNLSSTFIEKFRNMRLLSFLLSLILVGLLSSPAAAHVITAGVGTITLHSDRSTLLIGIPVGFFQDVDLDGDGLLQQDEIEQSRTQMIEQLQAAIELRVGGQLGTVLDDQIMVTSVPTDQRRSTNQIEWLRLLSYPPESLSKPVSLALSPSALSTRYMIQVLRNDDTETVVLTGDYPSHTFLKSGWGTLLAFFEQGVEHILAGYDHILFLMVVLISFVSLRRWIYVLTFFTIAHGITYGLATFNLVQVSPQLIEPVIALTIVVTAGVHLLGWRPALSVEAASVFSVGLFHGLGFASSMAELFKEKRFPLASVFGFNAGVEIGQIFIAGLLGLVILGLSRLKTGLKINQTLTQMVAWAAIVIGGYWFVERICF